MSLEMILIISGNFKYLPIGCISPLYSQKDAWHSRLYTSTGALRAMRLFNLFFSIMVGGNGAVVYKFVYLFS